MKAGIYESFNARNYTPEQVAETFIANDDYRDLWRNEHTVVLGPRGSGKTTLFKMLTVKALHSWDSTYAKELRIRRPFTAIYVPTDMHWHHQLKSASEQLEHAPAFSLAASRAAVTTSVFLALTKTFQDRLIHEFTAAPRFESEFCKLLLTSWELPKAMPSLDMVLLMLKARVSEIRKYINEFIFLEKDDAQIKDIPSYFHIDYFSAMDFACQGFDTFFRIDIAEKWALCLDELELAPPWLQKLAFSQQRSAEEKFLIKLSTSPIPSILGETEARPKQDLRLITIWNHPGRELEGFSDALACSVLNRRLGEKASPDFLFGSSQLIEKTGKTEKYARGSAEWKLFKELAEWDQSLRSLLSDNGLDPNDPFTEDIKIRDSFLRKAKPIALMRQAFLKATPDGRQFFRTRKLATIYFGTQAIYRISDGNPRRLIGILGDLASKLSRSKDGSFAPLGENEQAEVLERASKQFLGYVHALPGGSTTLGGDYAIDLATILKAVATCFRQDILGENFNLDPIGSFRVDSHLNEGVIELLRLGVYHGALVHIDPVPDAIETDLKGKRLRLSYMLAPMFRLPLNLYDPLSLTSLLRRSTRLRVKRALPSIVVQEELRFTKGK